MERPQTRGEEIASASAHGAGILFCLIAFPFMIVRALHYCPSSLVAAVSIFGFGMLMVYASSTFMHITRNKMVEAALERMDHISIFILIAGTYTPIVIKYTNASTAKMFLLVMWSLVAIGIILKVLFFGKYKLLSLLSYILLGLMLVFIAHPLLHNMPNTVLWLMLSGIMAYLTGVIFFLWRKLSYSHAIWHVFVLAGSVTHFVAVYKGLSTV